MFIAQIFQNVHIFHYLSSGNGGYSVQPFRNNVVLDTDSKESTAQEMVGTNIANYRIYNHILIILECHKNNDISINSI